MIMIRVVAVHIDLMDMEQLLIIMSYDKYNKQELTNLNPSLT